MMNSCLLIYPYIESKPAKPASHWNTCVILKRSPHRAPESFFKSTVVYEIAGDRTRALRDLKTALELGYLLKDVQNEPELVSLSSDPSCHRIISEAQASDRQL